MAEDRIVNFNLRLQADLHQKLVSLANKEHRSLHQQIIHMLDEAAKLLSQQDSE